MCERAYIEMIVHLTMGFLENNYAKIEKKIRMFFDDFEEEEEELENRSLR